MTLSYKSSESSCTKQESAPETSRRIVFEQKNALGKQKNAPETSRRITFEQNNRSRKSRYAMRILHFGTFGNCVIRNGMVFLSSDGTDGNAQRSGYGQSRLLLPSFIPSTPDTVSKLLEERGYRRSSKTHSTPMACGGLCSPSLERGVRTTYVTLEVLAGWSAMPTVRYSTNGDKNSQHCMRASPLRSETMAVAARYFGVSEPRVRDEESKGNEAGEKHCVSTALLAN